MTRQVFCFACVALVVCLIAVQLFGDMPPEVKKKFKELINSPNATDRVEAISLLSQAEEAKAYGILLQILEQDKDEEVIKAAFELMKCFKDASVISKVCKLATKTKDIARRTEYIKVIWEYDSEKAFNIVLKLRRDTAWEVRITVADLLGETFNKKGLEKAKKVIPMLIKWFPKESERRTQNRVVAALYYLTGKDFGFDKAAWQKWWDMAKEDYGQKPGEGMIDKDGDGKPDMTTRPTWRDPVAREDPNRPRPRFFGHELKNARVAFVIDISGSMQGDAGAGTKLDVVKKEMTKTINAFDKRYWFNMFFYSVGCMIWKPKLQKATDTNKQEAIKYIQRQSGMGMTDIGNALRKAGEDADTDTIILLSDGAPTAGITDIDQLLKDVRSWNKFKKIKINTVGMQGCDSNFLSRLAKENGGTFTMAP